MITENVFRRTLLLRFGNSSGTGFLVDKNGKQYLVTAEHVVRGFKDGDKLSISYRGDWATSFPALVGHGNDGLDISVLALERVLVRNGNLLYDEKTKGKSDLEGCMLGQEVYFLGFPFGMYSDFGELNNHFPAPLIKKATFSGSIQNVNVNVALLDGINNPGFSGGPVLYRNPNDFRSKLYAMSVISGYRTHGADVYYQEQLTELHVLENTGIIISYGINHAVDMIDANPKGVPL